MLKGNDFESIPDLWGLICFQIKHAMMWKAKVLKSCCWKVSLVRWRKRSCVLGWNKSWIGAFIDGQRTEHVKANAAGSRDRGVATYWMLEGQQPQTWQVFSPPLQVSEIWPNLFQSPTQVAGTDIIGNQWTRGFDSQEKGITWVCVKGITWVCVCVLEPYDVSS